MGVVRREGDWRLEKKEDGKYEITYQKEPQMQVLTDNYKAGMMDSPIGTVPVREVSSYSEAEGLFEEMAHGDPPTGMGTLSVAAGQAVETDTTEAIEIGGGEGEELEGMNLPPGGFAVVFLIAGGLVLGNIGFAPGSVQFLLGLGLVGGGVAILGFAGFIYHRNGYAEAFEFLVSIEDDDSPNTSKNESSESEKTPPTPEKMKNTLIFDRADQRCEWCGERFDHPHVHHIEPRREGGPNEPGNLIVLCPNCHEKADREAIPRSKLKAKVRRLPSVSVS